MINIYLIDPDRLLMDQIIRIDIQQDLEKTFADIAKVVRYFCADPCVNEGVDAGVMSKLDFPVYILKGVTGSQAVRTAERLVPIDASKKKELARKWNTGKSFGISRKVALVNLDGLVGLADISAVIKHELGHCLGLGEPDFATGD